MNNQIVDAYGPHLILDAYGCPADLLASKSLVEKYLEEMPQVIGMTKILGPNVLEYEAEVEEDSGITGFVIIAESHISIHTYPHKGYFSLDVFSCKVFNMAMAIDYTVSCFQPRSYDNQLLVRGKEFPRDVKIVEEFLIRERTAC